MVPSMWHSVAVEVDEWDAPTHSAVQEVNREEATTLGGRVKEGGHLQGIQCLWAPLEMVTSFRYLGRVISAADDD